MKARVLMVFVVLVFIISNSVFALSPGTDVLVPAAGRSEPWITDLYVMNPGAETVSVSVSWLRRGNANPDPATVTFDLAGGETSILEDVIFSSFGRTSAGGAFRVEASAPVIVNSRIYAVDGSSTVGQGFEGVPSSSATSGGRTTDVVGLSHGAVFRTNVYALAAGGGAAISFSLVDPGGEELASRNLQLEEWEPYLRSITDLFSGLVDFPHATLRATVTSGSAVIGASKVDNASTDPTTLESSVATSGGGADGEYAIATWDSLDFAGGGRLVIDGGEVIGITATYFNWDKVSPSGVAECTELFMIETEFDPAVPVADFAGAGVSFDQHYDNGATMTFNVSMTVDGGSAITGSIGAFGSDHPLWLEGCDGEFPDMVLTGGKRE